MKNLKLKLSIIVLTITLTSCNSTFIEQEELESLAEQAYFEGQKDALNGDVRIQKVKLDNKQDSCFIWVKSPWNNGQNPKFNPSYLGSKNIFSK